MTVPIFAKKNTALTFYISVLQTISGVVQGQGAQFQSSPTIAAGDAKVSIDGGSFSNLTNLPTVTPPAGKTVQFSLTASEMNGDNISVVFSDQTSPAEWCDVLIQIRTYTRTFDDLFYATYQLPEIASADGTAPTVQQALYETLQFLTEKAVAGTTVTVKKVDGSTQLMTFTLDNALTPTSITRNS